VFFFLNHARRCDSGTITDVHVFQSKVRFNGMAQIYESELNMKGQHPDSIAMISIAPDAFLEM
jgi:hypothetical protein